MIKPPPPPPILVFTSLVLRFAESPKKASLFQISLRSLLKLDAKLETLLPLSPFPLFPKKISKYNNLERRKERKEKREEKREIERKKGIDLPWPSSDRLINAEYSRVGGRRGRRSFLEKRARSSGALSRDALIGGCDLWSLVEKSVYPRYTVLPVVQKQVLPSFFFSLSPSLPLPPPTPAALHPRYTG